MDYRIAYSEIKVLEIEVRSYADEGYRVRYDFGRGLISWRDYYMWNNNFMKSITDAKMEILSKRLPASRLLEVLDTFVKGNYSEYDILKRHGKWQIVVEFSDGMKISHTEEDIFPVEWIEWRSIVEGTTECTFRLH
ncbi:hypothetical protein SAMN02910456_02352 [Ruminococcaceae bacterium YRB3002]|nr:hypothetical protein SAMN02910456_02352 [Ruminococcaceae bacterium YRB3002]